MLLDYLKLRTINFSHLRDQIKRKKATSERFGLIILLVLSITGVSAQTILIDPTQEGGFNNGLSGWTLANEGTEATKWVVGNAVSATNVATSQAGNTTINSYSVTLSAANSKVAIGQLVTGSGIPTKTYVSNISGTNLTLTQAATATGSGVILNFAAIGANISGNSAYVSSDNGLTNGYNYSASRRIYFYRDIKLPLNQTAYSLTFDIRSNGTQFADSWQVFVAPTTTTPVGSDTGTVPPSVPTDLADAVSLTYGAGLLYPQTVFATIPPSFAGKDVRLIFMWTNDASNGAGYPAAIDNIKLTSRVAGDVNSVSSGIFSNASTWDVGVPTAADNLIVNSIHIVNIDERSVTVGGLGINGLVDFGFVSDDLNVLGNVVISGSSARLNLIQAGTSTGKNLRVAGDMEVSAGGRLDVTGGSTSSLALNGSSPQTVTIDDTGLLGGTVASITTTNRLGVINNLILNNTSTETPNILWNVSTTADVRIASLLRLTKGRVTIFGTSKFILGNYASFADAASATATSGLWVPVGQGFTNGTIGRFFGTGVTSPLFENGNEYTSQPFPFINAKGDKRHAFIVRRTITGGVGGEVYITYTDSDTVSSASAVDGSYMVTDIYDGSWTITKDGTYANSAGTDLGFYATGAYNALDGSSRILLNSTTVISGTHINGSNSPFVMRSGVSSSDLFSGPLFVGINSASKQGAVTKTSAKTGDWNTADTWSPPGIPVCSDVVNIASGNEVTVSGAASAAGVNILSGGTLTNATGSSLTVGCTNNNALFTNSGTLNISAGTLTVNGSVLNKAGSVFNQTGGEIIVDGNDNGKVATSVGQGGSLFKLDNPSSISLTAGKITIVDPLVNSVKNTSAVTTVSFDTPTVVSVTTNITSGVPINTSIITTTSNGQLGIKPYFGQVVSGPGFAPETTITAVTAVNQNSPYVITLSTPTIAALTTGSTVTLSGMANGCSAVFINTADPNSNYSLLAVGQQFIPGGGIPEGTTITALEAGVIILSKSVTGLLPNPIATPQILTLQGASVGCPVLILNAANPAIKAGMAITGDGIPLGATISSIFFNNPANPSVDGRALTMSVPAVSGITNPVTLSFYDGNPSSYAFLYNSPNHYAAGLNHTLQFGNGQSTDTGGVITNGFLTSMSFGGGVLSLGNLNIMTGSASRLVSNSNILNVQNNLTISSGGILKKIKQLGISTNVYGAGYFGGNIINDGIVYTRNAQQPFVLANFLNGAQASTAIAQTISGTGAFFDTYEPSSGVGFGGGIANLTIDNTSSGGVTIDMPNFNVELALTMTNGILHTSPDKPLYHGAAFVGGLGGPTINAASNFGNTCYIDGPVVKTYSTNFTNNDPSNQAFIIPLGKSGKYMPISVGFTGGNGLVFRAEAFNSNGGNPSTNIANLSSNRWKVERVGLTGALTDFKVRVGASDIIASHIPVQATNDEGTYDNTLGAASVYAAAGAITSYSVNNVTTTAATLGANYTGYFSYATGPNCIGTPSPGNTIADLSSTTLAAIQNCATTNGIIAGNTAVTLNAANPSIIPGLTVTGVGIQPGTTVVSINLTALVLSLAPTQSSTTQIPLSFYQIQSSSSLCGTQTATLSLQNPGTGFGLTYQWQKSLDDIAYSNIAGATSATYIASVSATAYFKCEVSCGTNKGTSESAKVTVSASAIIGTTPGSACSDGSPVQVTLGAQASTGTISWYDSETSTNVLNTGSSFTTPPILSTTTYYAGTDTDSSTLNSFLRAFTGTSTRNDNYTGLVFNTNKKIILNTVKVYPKQTGVDDNLQITIALFDSGGNMIAGPTRFDPISNTSTTNTTALPWPAQIVNLNYTVPTGTGYKLFVINGLTSLNGLGASGSVNRIPVTQGAVSIVGTVESSNGPTLSSSSSTTVFLQMFYDWNWSEICTSARVPVVATVNPLPICDITGNNIICADASASFTASGGTDYSWTGPGGFTAATATISNLTAAGSYDVIVTDANTCSSTCSRVLTVNPLPTCNILGNNIICAGDSASFVATGGTGYSWTGPEGFTADTAIITNLTAAGSYNVTVTDDNSCSNSCNRVLTVNPLPSCAITGNNIICADASASFEATGGTGYAWTGPGGFAANTATISDLNVAGSYNVTVTDDNSCTSSCSRVLTVNPLPATFTISQSAPQVCPNGLLMILTAVASNADSFVAPIWLPETGLYLDAEATVVYTGTAEFTVYARPTVDTEYTATASIADTGCSTTANTTVIVASEPVATSVKQNVTVPMGDTLENALCLTDTNKVLTLDEGYVGTIQWQTVVQADTPDSNTVWINIDEANAAQYNITTPEDGLNWFRVRLTTEFCFPVYTDPQFVYYKGCLGIPDVYVDTFAITAYPNPYTDNFSLNLKTLGSENVNVIVFDMIGRLIDQREVAPFELSKQKYGDFYPTGVYNVLVTQGTEAKTLRLIKR